MVTSELASVASEASHVHFQRRLDLLGDLISHWKSAHEVTITEVVTGNGCVAPTILCVLNIYR